MRTALTNDLAQAAEVIRRGGVCAFPTETVYGLGADVFNERAVAKIFDAKHRPADNPLIAHISDKTQIERLASAITPTAAKLIEAFFPGPLTVVLPKTEAVPPIATAGLQTIGIRMPSFELAHRFLELCETPVVAPSANLSGRPSPTTWQAVYEDLAGRIDCILQAEAADIGLESTVVDCTGTTPLLLRKGSVSIEELILVVPDLQTSDVARDEVSRSPGLKHRHYSPRARVVLIDGPGKNDSRNSAAFIGLDRPHREFQSVKVCIDINEYARSVFAFFRECDAKGIEVIYCQTVSELGIGAALMDRLRRAAEE
ncbi:MAG: L-threonylcarbamoyladenylate synthase [Acidobacteriota bacterium]